MSIEHANMTFHYQIDQVKISHQMLTRNINFEFQGVCYLCLADNNFSRKLCFAYLQDLQSEFFVQYGNRIDKVTRPYHFMKDFKIFPFEIEYLVILKM